LENAAAANVCGVFAMIEAPVKAPSSRQAIVRATVSVE
jgi:hypothetical protein